MALLFDASSVAAGSSAFAALIWWIVPISALIGGIGYVIWVSKFKRKFESETSRSVGNFQRFQESFRNEAVATHEQAASDEESISEDRQSEDRNS